MEVAEPTSAQPREDMTGRRGSALPKGLLPSAAVPPRPAAYRATKPRCGDFRDRQRRQQSRWNQLHQPRWHRFGVLGKLPAGTSVTLTATVTNTKRDMFTGWSGGGCAGSTPTCTVAFSANQSVQATFQKQQRQPRA